MFFLKTKEEEEEWWYGDYRDKDYNRSMEDKTHLAQTTNNTRTGNYDLAKMNNCVIVAR